MGNGMSGPGGEEKVEEVKQSGKEVKEEEKKPAEEEKQKTWVIGKEL